jgi:hypothetical protein
MSRRPIARSPDLSRLLAEGYRLSIKAAYLVVTDIPYVKEDRSIAFGALVAPLTLRDDVAIQPADHTIYFVGAYPCDQHGRPIEAIRNSTPPITIKDGLVAQQRFSAKPPKGNYDDFYEKFSTYAAILSGPARQIDPSVTPHPGGFVAADTDDDTIFKYLDTASPRADITAVSAKLEKRKVHIIGLGGTGGYILDFVAKTPVEEIHLWDGDRFEQHNAFRAPGAASGEELAAAPYKVDYFSSIYAKMRNGIFAHAEFLGPLNIDHLRNADFVFVSIDNGPARDFILGRLEAFGVAYTDVGMGLVLQDGALTGMLRATTSTPVKRDHVRGNGRISFAKVEENNEYERNIQVADLNALNALLAVIKWKKLCGFYVDLEREYHSVYAIDGNDITNEDANES